jgi:Zn-dependent protease with chaperone function
MDGETESPSAAPRPPVVYYDGTSSRRHLVTLAFNDRLELVEPAEAPVIWPYDDIRRADGPAGVLRLTCLTAPTLARLEIRDAAIAADLVSRCTRLDENLPGRHGIAPIVGWSLAAAVSIVVMVLFGIPFVADRLAPLVPSSFERRLGAVADGQVRSIFGATNCEREPGRLAFAKLVNALRGAAGMDTSVQTAVLASPIPNAFALPGGKVYLFNGLLTKAQDADEIAGVIAHELGHLQHRDSIRNLISQGGSSFLVGLLFGDITGSGALIFASRSLVNASYSREVEEGADGFAIDVMHKLGRSPKPMGELMLRVTGKQLDNALSIVSSHPLSEDRLARMSREDGPANGPPLLTPEEWRSLKSICRARP